MASKADYSRICSECRHCIVEKNGYILCLAVRDLFSGRVLQLGAVTVRGKNGQCGPAGRLYETLNRTEAAE